MQGFFSDLLSREFLAYVQPASGKFRSFLLASLQRWLSKQAQRDNRLKRGGGWERIALDFLTDGTTFPELVEDEEPGRAFDRQWALEVVDRALIRLRTAYAARGRDDMFTSLRGALPGGEALPPYDVLAARTGLGEPALRKAVHDMRNRFAEAIRQEISSTVQDPAEVDDEVRYLAALLRQ